MYNHLLGLFALKQLYSGYPLSEQLLGDPLSHSDDFLPNGLNPDDQFQSCYLLRFPLLSEQQKLLSAELYALIS